MNPTTADDRIVEDAYPLTAMQAGMVYESVQTQRSATYHDVLTLTLDGPFDPSSLDGAVGELVRRHPTLRTCFDLTSLSEPAQLVYAQARLPVQVVDLRDRPEEAARDEVGRWRDEERFRSYDLDVAPLLRLTAHLLSGSRFTLTISFHHAVLDGWSVASLVTELIGRYGARLTGTSLPAEPLPNAYPELVAAERAATTAPDTVAYWESVLAGSSASRLPREPGRPTGGDRVARYLTRTVAPDVASGLDALAHATGTSLRSVLLAVHLHVLSRLTGEDDVLTGTVTHGRPETETGAQVLGLFLNTVAVRGSGPAASWTDLVTRTHRDYVQMLPHRRFPLLEAQRIANRSPLFDTGFDLRDFHVYRDMDDEAPVVVVRGDHHETTDVPFGASFSRTRDRHGLVMQLAYDRTEFPPEQVGRMADLYLAALSAAAADPGAVPGTELPAGTGTSRPRVAEDFPALHATVAHWAAVRPDAVAVDDAGGEITYARLWRESCAVARRLAEHGVSREAVVGVAMPRSASGVATILGVLQAGATVLPLDLDHPDARLDALVEQSGAAVLLTHGDLAHRFGGSARVVAVDDLVAARDGGPADPASATDPDAAAVVIFTSGSTGRPKGVVLSHRATVHVSVVAADIGLDETCRVAHRSPLSVDAAVGELVLAFASGGTAVVVPTEAVADPAGFRACVTDHRISTVVLVPSLISVHVEAGTFGACQDLAQVLSVGEQLSPALARAFLEQSTARLYNSYGPSEGGIGATLSQVTAEHAARASSGVPVGAAVGDGDMYVLDRAGRPAPTGTPGEIYFGGSLLARGYLGQPGLTAGTFVPDHLSGVPGARLYRTGDRARVFADGTIRFLGRLDTQLKIRGVRAEPEEIEARLAEFPDVRQAVVGLVETSGPRERAQQVLVAYLRWRGTERAEPNALRAFLARRLPRALVPTAFVTVDEFAMLPNGKVDRSALPVPDLGSDAVYEPPGDDVERRLVELWEDVLGVPSVGVRDDFFALGGDSIRALQLVLRIRTGFGKELEIDAMLSNPTVRELAPLVRDADGALPADRAVRLHAGGSGTPLVFLHALGGQVFTYQPIARLLGPDRPVYAVPALGFRDGEAPHTSLDEMADDYAARIADVCPAGPVFLAGYCIGGNIATEVARRLQAMGRTVPLVLVFWSHADSPVAPDVRDDAALMMYALAGKITDLDLDELAGLSPEQQLVAVVDSAASAGSLNPAATDLDQARRILAVYRANAHALDRYRHAPYAGDLVLLKPVDDPFEVDDDFCWGEVTHGRFTSRLIPGRAGTATAEPHVAETAVIVKELLDHAE